MATFTDPEFFGEIRPNKLVDVIFRLDMIREEIDVRRTVILDESPSYYIILSQVEPPVLASDRNRVVEVTFLHTLEGELGPRRFGFNARIIRLLPDYRLAGGGVDPAWVLTYPDKFRETALRMHFRLEPSLTLDLDLRLPDEGVDVSVVDISLGGARLSLPGWVSWSRHKRLRVQLSVEGLVYGLRARVVRVIPSGTGRYVHVGIKFDDMQPELRRNLHRVIQANSREQLRRRAGLSGRGPLR